MTIRAYARLSRTDVRRGDTLANHLSMLRTLARQHQLPLADDDIISEIEQSDRIDTRAGLMTILDDLTAGRCTHLLVYDVARLSRGLEDQWAAIKRALYRNQAHLVTPRGVYRFDNALDTTILDVEAVLARRYRWEYSVKRQHHTAERTRRGIRSSGVAPYGYRWIPATYEGQRKVIDGRLEPDRATYHVLVELLDRILSEGTHVIACDLNARGIPVPSSGLPSSECTAWSASTVRAIAINPAYAGYTVHRQEVARERGLVRLPEDRWIWSETEGDYEHPISLDRHQEILEAIRSRYRGGPPSVALLSGILYCCAGRSMCRCGRQYRCRCSPDHSGSTIRYTGLEAYAKQVVERVLAAIQPEGLPIRQQGIDRSMLARDIVAAQRSLEEVSRSLDDLLSRSAFYARLPGFGQARYDAAVSTLSAQGEELRRRIASLRSEIARPDPASAAAMLLAARDLGPALWAETPSWTAKQHRLLVAAVISRIDLHAPPGPRRKVRHATVTLHPDLPQVPIPAANLRRSHLI
ncbi:MAG: recombinase family protein [Armatimonadetes bacterium]|nr:recombinase family protein [Armatimonadota bacterium]